MMYKRWMSLLLAMILTVAIVFPGKAVAVTSEDQDVTETTGETMNTDETTAMEESSEESEIEELESLDEIVADEQGVAVMSMRPISEVYCSLILYNFTDAKLATLTIDDVLANLKDSSGNSVKISESATTAWRYVMDETDNIETYETYTLGEGQPIDLSYAEGASAFQLQLIVGSGGQLASGNVRYIIRVYVTNTIDEAFEYELYTQSDGGSRTKVVPEKLQETYTEESGLSMISLIYMNSDHTEGAEYYFGFSSLASEHPNITVDVYTTDEFMVSVKTSGDLR